jgi:hypothetical protein
LAIAVLKKKKPGGAMPIGKHKNKIGQGPYLYQILFFVALFQKI